MSFPRCQVRDLFTLTSRVLTDEGYMLAPGKISRTGVQEYRARELGMDSAGDGDRIIRLYRPPDEVFAPEALSSFADKPITLNHPPDNVTADNWRKIAMGDVREVAREGDHVGAKLAIRDKAAVRAVMDGKAQLSCGYAFDCDMTAGRTADGQAYDGIQRNIRGNHIAIVDSARGGPGCRVGDHDHDTEERPMATRTIVIDGISIELENTAASLVEKIVGDAKKNEKAALDLATMAETRAKAADEALKAEKTAAAKLVADHATALAEANAKILTPGQIEAMAAERSKVVGDAAKLCPEFKAEGKSVAAIRAEVLTEVIAKDEALKPVALAVLGGVELSKAPEVIVTAAFNAIAATKPAQATDSQRRTADDSVSRALLGTDGTHVTDGPELTGRALMMFRENHAGRGPAEEKQYQQERRQ